MSILVHVVVGELDLVEGDVILHPVGAACGAVRVHIQPAQRGIGFKGVSHDR